MLNLTQLKVLEAPGIHRTPLSYGARQIYAATYGDPPDPPATTALIEILAAMGTTLQAGE